MAIVPIPNAPAAISLTGNEQVPAIQAGTRIRVTTAQIAMLARGLGSFGTVFPLNPITGVYTLQPSDYVVQSNSAAGVPTLPTAVGITGQAYIMKNNSGGSITPVTTGGQTIDGSSPGAISNHGVLRVYSDGANWQSW